MELDKLEIALRRRNAWEAIDLGFAVGRRWFLPLWLLWLASAIPVGIVLFVLLYEQLWLLALLVWWFKPLYEPPLLFWLSRAVFGEQLPVKSVLKQWPGIVKPQLLLNLTLRRFNPSRSFTMPVALLEQLRGKPRRNRINLLGRNQHAAAWLTIVGLVLETILELALITTLFILIPEDLRWTSLDDLIFAPGRIGEWLQLLGALLCISLIAPFYVAAGFALYLHRRSELEGWDIEISFRRISERLQQEKSKQRGSLKTLLMLGVLFCFSLSPQQADAARNVSQAESSTVIGQVLEDEAFGRYEENSYWKYVGQSEPDEKDDDHWILDLLDAFFKRLSGFFQGYAEIAKGLMWVVGIALVAYLIYRVAGNSDWFSQLSRKPKKTSGKTPQELFGLQLDPEQLPDDPAGEARQLIKQGAYREALSLLYRGALIDLVLRQQIEIPDSATEGECKKLVDACRSSGESEYFGELTDSWLHMAYGHIQPETDHLLTLCDRWQGVYGNVER